MWELFSFLGANKIVQILTSNKHIALHKINSRIFLAQHRALAGVMWWIQIFKEGAYI